jgi:alpha-glucosidase (family GH31 glycosyl hydrolase)
MDVMNYFDHLQDQDPGAFNKRTQSIMKNVLEVRYTLLPFLYTLLVKSHLSGVPAARPLFFRYYFQTKCDLL